MQNPPKYKDDMRLTYENKSDIIPNNVVKHQEMFNQKVGVELCMKQ